LLFAGNDVAIFEQTHFPEVFVSLECPDDLPVFPIENIPQTIPAPGSHVLFLQEAKTRDIGKRNCASALVVLQFPHIYGVVVRAADDDVIRDLL